MKQTKENKINYSKFHQNLPLTRGQEAMWFEYKVNPNSTSYNTLVQLKLEGDVNPERFCQAASEVVAYFEMLHSYFVEHDGKTFLSFSDEKYELEFIDLGNEKKESKKNKELAEKILDEKRHAAIDLTKFPLISAALIKSADKTFYFTGVVPHIISDGASALFFLQALSVTYNEGVKGLREKYDETKKSWGEYVDFLENEKQIKDQNAAFKYWQDSLESATHKVDFSNAKKDIIADNIGGREPFTVSTESFIKMKKLAFANRTSIFSVLCAFFASFLYRFYNQNDIIIGYPVNSRPAGYRHAFGFFVNILPIRLNLSHNPTFNELIKEIDQKRRADKKFQYLSSLDIIKSKRNVDQDFDGLMFNCSMVETISRLQNLELNNIKSTSLDNKDIEIHDDLSFIYELDHNEIKLWFEYRKCLFENISIVKMVDSMKSFIQSATLDPDQNILNYQLLKDKEQNKIVNNFNKAKFLKDDKNLHQFFEKSAKYHKNKTSIKAENKEISYDILNKRANKIANHLINQNVKIGDNVAVILERSIDQIASLLGILKAGAAYVPINKKHPKDRIDSIISDAKPKIIIDHQFLNKINEENDKNPNLEIDIKSAAYIIYTSGTSGKPKGVKISHQAVSKRISWLKNQFKLTHKDKILQNTHYSFDISVAEIFWPLASGSALILANEEKAVDANYLLNLIKSNQITTSCITPSALNSLIKHSEDNDLKSLKLVLACGEVLSKNLVEDFYENCSAILYNLYGPTENTIYATYKKCSYEDEVITIGKPISNTLTYILNDQQQVQPIGAAGELYLGGDALADEYLNRSELTKEKFIQNPFADGLIYKTGDICCFGENSEIIYLSRKDDQVKIRGYRIELSEINSVYLKNNKIIDAATTIKGKNKQIILYYQADKELENLREFAHTTLPEYMLPNRFIKIDKIPKLSSGKIDHKILQNLKDEIEVKNLIKPKSEKEEEVAQIFCEILRVNKDKIGTNISFFELGGDSLMLIELSCALEKINIFIEPHELFLHRDIKNIIKNAKNFKAITADQSEVIGEMELLPRQVKFFEDGILAENHWNRAMMVQFKQDINLEILESSLYEVIKHHDGLRIAFKNNKAFYQSFKSNHAKIKSFDLSKLDKTEQEKKLSTILNEHHQSFDLAKAPLIQTLYFNFNKKKQVIALIMHHLLIDMRSLRIVLEDVLHVYRQKILKLPFSLPAKTTSLKEYANRLFQYQNSNDLEKEVNYWKNELNSTNQKIPFDKNFTINEIVEKNQKLTNIVLDKKQTTKLLNSSDKPVNEILLEKFALAFKNWSESEELVINTCSHGREKLFNDVDLSRTVGWINTVYPLKINLKEEISHQISNKTNSAKIGSINYMVLRFLKKQEELQDKEPIIFFNYVSKIDTSTPDGFKAKLIKNPDDTYTLNQNNKACYVLYLEAAIVEKKVNIKLAYASELFDDKSINDFVRLLV